MCNPLGPLVTACWQRQDPRLYQIAALAGLCGYGVVWLDFAVSGVQVATLLATVLLTQAACSRLWQRPTYDPRSALISGLSLCLLLRTNSLALTILTAVITIASKFVLRWRGKHLLNPTNFGMVAMMLGTEQVWASPGQWGSAASCALLLASLGGLVVYRATRSDVTYAFVIWYLALHSGRAWFLGDPLSVPLHQFQNGALVLFAFFMISDPKTTPDTRLGRVLFAGMVAVVAWYMQFAWYWPDALLWSLASCCLAVPLLDWLCPGRQYAWPQSDHAAAHGVRAHALQAPVPLEAGAERRFDGVHITRPCAPAQHRLLGPGCPGLLRLLRGQSGHTTVQ